MPKYTAVQRGTNEAGLISGLKTLLNATNNYPRDPLTVDDTADKKTFDRALATSTLYGYGDSFGTASTKTLVNLTKRLRGVLLADPTALATLPEWITRIVRAADSNGLAAANFKMDQFLEMYKENFRLYMPSGNVWEDNFRRFVNFIFADGRITDRRSASYLLATAMHEGRAAADQWKATWNPVSETNGANKDYGGLQTIVDWEGDPIDAQGNEIAEITDRAAIQRGGATLANISRRGKNHYYAVAQVLRQRYYGRGYVQITHQENYRAMDEALGLNGTLHRNPELAVTDAQVSYNTSSYGLVNGSFRGPKRRVVGQGFIGGYKLGDYITDTGTDYVGARAVVNGDGATNGRLIAGYAETFQAMYDAALS